MEPLIFQKSDLFSLGAELEFQLLDPRTMDLRPMAPVILKKLDGESQTNFKPEFLESMVEVATDVCPDMATLADNLASLCRRMEGLARQEECLIYSNSLHPFGRLSERKFSDNARYARIMEDLQIVGRRLVTQGLHVHVGLSSPEQAILVNDSLRHFLPIFLALSGSSPFFQHEDTGFHSYRTKLFEALPRSGTPGPLLSWSGYQELAGFLLESGVIQSVKEIWWDVRPHPSFGTVEIRICDLPARFDEILALVALIQATTALIVKQKLTLDYHREIILNNKWQAARYGLEGYYLNPSHNSKTPLRQAAAHLLEMIRPLASELGSTPFLKPLERIMVQGTSSKMQRTIFMEHGLFSAMVAEMQGEFWK